MATKLTSPLIGNTTEVPTTPPLSSPGLRAFLVLDATLLIVACLGLIYVVTSSRLANRLRRERPKLSFKLRHKFSCCHCQYFSQNHYLSCALHPTIALTEQAANCRDYAPRDLAATRKTASSKDIQ
jgi:hypothetical protein